MLQRRFCRRHLFDPRVLAVHHLEVYLECHGQHPYHPRLSGVFWFGMQTFDIKSFVIERDVFVSARERDVAPL